MYILELKKENAICFYIYFRQSEYLSLREVRNPLLNVFANHSHVCTSQKSQRPGTNIYFASTEHVLIFPYVAW